MTGAFLSSRKQNYTPPNPFSLAMLHGVRTDQIAPVIIWTSALSLITLAWLA